MSNLSSTFTLVFRAAENVASQVIYIGSGPPYHAIHYVQCKVAKPNLSKPVLASHAQ